MSYIVLLLLLIGQYALYRRMAKARTLLRRWKEGPLVPAQVVSCVPIRDRKHDQINEYRLRLRFVLPDGQAWEMGHTTYDEPLDEYPVWFNSKRKKEFLVVDHPRSEKMVIAICQTVFAICCLAELVAVVFLAANS